MCCEELEEPWGRLVGEGGEGGEAGEDGEVVPVLGESFTIGRGKCSDLEISDNKYVSTMHCKLVHDDKGCNYLKDLSSNGTLLNGGKIGKNNQVRIKNGDVIAIVFRKDNPRFNVSFKFEDLCNAGDPDCDGTLDYEISETDVTEEDTAGTKRKREKSEEVPAAKRSASEHKLESAETAPKPALLKTDSIEETLICQICQEMLHDCVSLQPCMHSYCAGCYSDWMSNSNTCPACRIKVERISKNHIVNNLVAAYVRANPDKKRDEEDIRELDAKNKITADMLYPKRKKHHFDDSDEDSDSDDTDTSDDSVHAFPILPPGFHLPLLAAPAPLFVCCQCPGYLGPAPAKLPPAYNCTQFTNHVLCMCCLKPMPDRRNIADIPPQTCGICGNAFCHMYWGCAKLGCHGCLNVFKDMDFVGDCLDSVVNGNLYESRVLRQYLEAKGKTVKDMLQECCAKLDAREYHTRCHGIASATHTCYSCALKNLKDLAYLYRKDIPNDELPVEVTARPDCHWGRNCRTQANRQHHAENFNHICEQTKF